MAFLNFRTTYYGIDIGTRNIAGIKLKKTLRGFKIIDMVLKPLPELAIREGRFQDPQLAVKLLRQVKDDLGISGQEVHLAFTGQNAVIRKVEMPLMTDKELSEAIRWEADKVLSYPVDEAFIDWIVLDRQGGTEDMMSILLIASRKDFIRSFLKPIKSAELRPANLSIFPIPLIHFLKQVKGFKDYTTTAVIDLGASATHLLIIKEGLPWLSRTIPIGGNDFSQAVMDSFGLTFTEAEDVKIESGTLTGEDKEGQPIIDMEDNPYLGVDDVLLSIAQDVIGEVRRSFVHYHMHNRGKQIEAIYLTGGSSLFPGLKELLEEALSVDVFPLEAGGNFSIDQKINDDFIEKKAFMTEALGLALSGVSK